MSKVYNGSAVPRHFVFVLADGSFVVQLSDIRVQDLLTGKYLHFHEDDFGHTITDPELNQLKAAGRVEHYNRNYVWLLSLPEPHQYNNLKTQERMPDRVRVYYVSTTLPQSQLPTIQTLLKGMGLDENYAAENRGNMVAIAGKGGALFPQFKDAEYIQHQLQGKAPDMFKNSAIAFVEAVRTEPNYNLNQEVKQAGNSDLATLISSQSDTTVTQGKRVVLLLKQESEQQAINKLCYDMKMDVGIARTGADALRLLEDGYSDLMVMDLELPDMHGWALLAKVREINDLSGLSLIVIAEATQANQQSFALTVAGVDVYLTRPVSLSRLRQNVWMALKDRNRQN